MSLFTVLYILKLFLKVLFALGEFIADFVPLL